MEVQDEIDKMTKQSSTGNLNYSSFREGEWTMQITKLQISQQKRLNVSVYCTDYCPLYKSCLFITHEHTFSTLDR